jgi:hypothetical protein
MALETGKAWYCVCVLLFASYNGRYERRLLQIAMQWKLTGRLVVE